MAAAGKSFEATIGVEVKGDTRSCVEIPDSAEFFGTGKTVRVDVTVDEVQLEVVARQDPGELQADVADAEDGDGGYDGQRLQEQRDLTAAALHAVLVGRLVGQRHRHE